MPDKRRTESVGGMSGAKFEEIMEVNLKFINRLEEENKILRHDLNERRKELKGIYDIEKIVDRYDTRDEILQAVVEILPPAYQYPEVTCSRINMHDSEYRSKNFIETEWKQASEIRVSGKPEGSVEVFYIEERPESYEGPFLQEERIFIDKIAHRIGKVTQRLMATVALQESEDRFRKLVEATSDLIWEVDENIVYTYVSPKIKEVLGYEPEEVIGKTPFHLMPSDEAKSLGAVFESIAAERKKFSGLENINIHKNGYHVILETSAVPFFDQGGTFRGYRGIDRDITKRKQTEDELKRMNIELHDTLNKIKQLSGLLPICASCKRIRTEKGYWENIERFITTHSEAEFSHSICDECAQRLYPEEFKKAE